MKKLVLIGGGAFSSEVLEVASQRDFQVIGYVDAKKTESNLEYLGRYEDLQSTSLKELNFFPSFGAINRKSLYKRSRSLKGYDPNSMISLVSPHAVVSNNVDLGVGVFVAHGAIINTGAKLGNYVIVNSGSIIGHDTEISDNSVIAGKVFIGGSVKVGSNTLIGPGVNIMQSIEIGSEVIISIGSNVARNIADKKTTIPKLSKNL